MNTNGAVSTDQLVASLANELCFLRRMTGAEQCLLERRNEGSHVSGQGVQVNDLVGFEDFQVLMVFFTGCTHEPTSAAEANSLAFLASGAHGLVVGAHFLEGILDVEEVVYVEGSLEPRDSAHWQLCDLATGWTRETLSLMSYQSLQALLAKDVEALEQLWLFVGLQTYPAGDLFLDLLESFLGSSGGFGSHVSVSSAAADKLERRSSQY